MTGITNLLQTPTANIAPQMKDNEALREILWIVNQLSGITGQPTASFTITPNNSQNLSTQVTKGIFVSVPSGVSTTVAFQLINDTTTQSVILQSSQYLPGNFMFVMSSGTTLNGATIVGYGE